LYSQDIKVGGTKLSKFGRVISFGEGITANFSSDLTVGGRNSELTVSDSLFNVAGTMNVAGRILLSETIANFSGNVSAGNMTISGTTLGTDLALTGSLVVSGKTSVATNSSIAVTGSGHFEFNGGLASTWTTQTNNPILVANTAGNVVKEFIYMQEGVGITVTADNDWNTARLLFRGGQGTLSVSDGATLEVASMLSISNVSGKISKISVEDGSLLIVGSTLGSYDFSATDSFVSFGELDDKANYLNFLNFAEGTIAFKEIGTAEQQSAFLSHVKLNGAFNEDLHFSGFDSGVGGYWLTTAIPEPSTWAAILGAVALGFAAYRRRK